MAKATKNTSNATTTEIIKLKANYFNNLAVGVVLGGAFVPYFALLQHIDAFSDLMGAIIGRKAWTTAATTEYRQIVILSLAFVTALVIGGYFQFRAFAMIKKLDNLSDHDRLAQTPRPPDQNGTPVRKMRPRRATP
jgi:large-conductance mechanosensitive channel